MTGPYTRLPRPTLWLVQEASVVVGGAEAGSVPSFRADVASFYLGKSLTTNDQYEAFDPSHARCEASSGDDEPAVNVSFREAVAYCEWYSRLSGKRFRLPSELEWELACRGPSGGGAPWGEDLERAGDFAWHAGNSGGRCHAVETLRGNAVGVHDTLGLAWEWTSSPYVLHEAASHDDRDDLGVTGPRVLRGGSFRTPARELSPTVRRPGPEDLRADDLGFRIARSL
jgi:formylglycine-generating enzyme required for sulfatase activity